MRALPLQVGRLFFAFSAVILGHCFAASAEVPCVIRVGSILPLSGEGAAWGVNAQRGIRLAEEERNASKGENRGCALSVIFEDSPSARPERALAAYRKLVSLDGVKFLIGLVNQDEVQALAPFFVRDGVFAVSSTTGSHTPKNMHSVWMHPPALGALLATYVRKHHRTAAILATDSAWDHTVAQAFRETFEREGGRIVALEEPPFNSTEVGAVVARVLSARPEAVVIPTYYLFTAYSRELSRLRFTGARYSAELDRDLIINASGTAEGTIAVGPAQPRTDFQERYRIRWGTSPDVPAAHFYDGLNMLADAIAAGGGTVSGVQHYLTGLSTYSGAAGLYRFDNGVTLFATSFYRVQGETLLPLE